MNRDEIIKLAQEAGASTVDADDPQCWIGAIAFTQQELERFAALVAAAEREACAEVCDYLLANPHTGGGWSDATIEAAATIRARGETK